MAVTTFGGCSNDICSIIAGYLIVPENPGAHLTSLFQITHNTEFLHITVDLKKQKRKYNELQGMSVGFGLREDAFKFLMDRLMEIFSQTHFIFKKNGCDVMQFSSISGITTPNEYIHAYGPPEIYVGDNDNGNLKEDTEREIKRWKSTYPQTYMTKELIVDLDNVELENENRATKPPAGKHIPYNPFHGQLLM